MKQGNVPLAGQYHPHINQLFKSLIAAFHTSNKMEDLVIIMHVILGQEKQQKRLSPERILTELQARGFLVICYLTQKRDKDEPYSVTFSLKVSSLLLTKLSLQLKIHEPRFGLDKPPVGTGEAGSGFGSLASQTQAKESDIDSPR